MSPDDTLNCLLIQPKFKDVNFWNFVEAARAVGAKAEAPPLGLLTVAALLPQRWTIRLVDLNVRELDDEEWARADLICVGGMIQQQTGILDTIERAKSSGKYVVVGGPDPSNQPEVYREADALVLGEGEATIPLWLDAWRAGEPRGIFSCEDKPDITTSPIPRFDLVDFDDYLHVGVQFSRGCPFNCEFCDIIELYGRRPRVKTSEQFIAEFESLYQLGYRGWVDIADDNFIGNKPKIRPMLAEFEKWCRRRRYPFYFSTEATINLADDEELLAAMRAVDFRYVFIGIETPDPALLIRTQKRINTRAPLLDRIDKIYEYGISVTAGFILGFDGERARSDESMISFIQQSGIVFAMVGLLSALPSTQLTRRLTREGRLLSPDGRLVGEGSFESRSDGNDNTAEGLNFVTSRDRVEIYRELANVVRVLYNPMSFMDRVLATTTRMQIARRHPVGWWEFKRVVRGLFCTVRDLGLRKKTRRLYWRNTLRSLLLGWRKFEFAQMMMATYPHFQRQMPHVLAKIDDSIEFDTHLATYPRAVAEESEGTRAAGKGLRIARARPVDGGLSAGPIARPTRPPLVPPS
ncbi:MAG: B12-binding domain-containing radical SAM protein [Gammaproteobacteria bacterium]|nr:B12-binding domain-containing radical SAM protein [Gammaproteobacteria bacterium]MDH3413419.1 B12-binding domain-containing radical SAM protein [Gammaproteobacteria bacterium]